jgi:hypothetical protein
MNRKIHIVLLKPPADQLAELAADKRIDLRGSQPGRRTTRSLAAGLITGRRSPQRARLSLAARPDHDAQESEQ